jgi:hypothetical protein
MKILRNGMLALALSTIAFLLPGQSQAQTCSPMCQQCMVYADAIYLQCYFGCGNNSSCQYGCQGQYSSIQQYCLTIP